ncbi:MAG: HAD family hydrolase [Planctomycetota bacterium]|jgi:phosphoglycolate phosphatase-like HAD superfamily hydrolase
MLILFDIDGTMLASQGAGMAAMLAAGQRLIGAHFSFEGIDVAGRIDPHIWADLAAAAGVDDPDGMHETFRATYHEILDANLTADPTPRLLPGVRELIARLETEASVTLGVLTGNYPETGKLKIETAGVDMDTFPVAAWGNDGSHRRDLPQVAMDRYRDATGREIAAARVVIIGDTPHDVDCARANGCRVIAVATGGYTSEALATCEPDLLVDDLSDTDQIVAWIAGTDAAG